MAISKDSVKAKFTVKFGKVNLTKNFKDSVIAKIAAKLDSEDDIDSTLELYEDVISESAAEADRIRTQAKKEAEKPAPKTGEEKQEDEEIPLPIDTPEYVKVIMAQIKKLNEKTEAIETSKKTESLVDRFKKDPRLKDVPSFIVDGYVPKNDEEFDAKIEFITEQYNQFAQDKKIALVGEDAPERANGGAGTVSTKAMDAAIETWAANKVPAQQQSK